MSEQSSYESDQKLIPLSVVFLVIGLIILGTVGAIWALVPAWMPPPLYAAVSIFGPETAVAHSTTAAPPPSPIAAAPAQAVPLLPETPVQTEEELPAYFVSVADAAKRALFEGQPVRIIIPQINLDAPVAQIGLGQVVGDNQTYYQWQVPDTFQAGWHDNSARLGEAGNTVLNGHHNIYGEVFRDLVDLSEGDEIILHDGRQTFTYQVTIKEILLERGQPMPARIENAQWIAPTEDERITLITCWPYTDNSHRLVIVAKPVSGDL